MPVYIDPVFWWPTEGLTGQALRVAKRHGGEWSHLWCDPGDEEELHRIARAAGMRREWFQAKPRFPHYDLVPTRRRAAIKAGAIEMNLRDWFRKKDNQPPNGPGR